MPSTGSYTRAIGRSVPPALIAPPMPHLHRSLALHPTSTGLIVRPYTPDRPAYAGQAVRILWGAHKPQAIDHWQQEDRDDGFVVDGLAGLLDGFQESYLLVIADSTLAATLPDPQASKIKAVDSLLAIPLGSLAAAQAVIDKHAAKQSSRRRSACLGTEEARDTPTATSDEEGSSSEEEEADAAPIPVPTATSTPKRPFWQRTFTPRFGKQPAPPPAAVNETAQAVRPSTPSTSSSITASPDSNTAAPPNAVDAPSLPDVAAAATTDEAAVDDAEVRASQQALDQKLVAECLRMLRGLLFSYDTDITRSLQAKHEQRAESSINHLPLWRLADKRFFFNRHLVEPLVQAGLHAYIIALVQGFAQSVTVPLPLQSVRTLNTAAANSPISLDLDLTILSRRSIERPGLRYQRRGINSSGGVANFVETEFIVAGTREGTCHVDSFVQIRGSIPVYWGQSPWALKPPPVLERTKEESRAAMKVHVEGLREKYGRLLLVNLAEQSGKEGSVVEAYRAGVESLGKDETELRYVGWDFHHEARGMRYDKITSDLIDNILKDDLEELQTFWTTSSETYSTQNGVPRVNCIDSLDRTNVVESAISRWVLNRHLVNLGITSGAEAGMHDDLDIAFNELWANNGDAISREYAGTSALKGDFTRTGKRNWRGAMNDASNSVARLLQSTVSDFFKQAAIDYILGVNTLAFQEFAERLETSDPGEIIRLAKIRQEAIETSVKEVIAEGETKVAAWTLLSPSELDVVRPAKGGKYEEKVLILSSKAVYVVGYEFALGKVTAYTRIPTGDILSVQHGAYILSSLDASTRDPTENHGFVLHYHDADATEKVHTYSLRTSSPKKARPASSSSISSLGSAALKPLKLPSAVSASMSSASSGPPLPPGAQRHYIAFKALRRDAVKISSSGGSSQLLDARGADDVEGKTAKDLVLSIVRKIRDEAEKVGAVEEGWEVEKDVISLAESKAQTSIVDRLKNDLYKAIWW
ncbi:hypothetical protein JCM11641_000310 [Rhodosporidiobolus odoratus]